MYVDRIAWTGWWALPTTLHTKVPLFPWDKKIESHSGLGHCPSRLVGFQQRLPAHFQQRPRCWLRRQPSIRPRRLAPLTPTHARPAHPHPHHPVQIEPQGLEWAMGRGANPLGPETVENARSSPLHGGQRPPHTPPCWLGPARRAAAGLSKGENRYHFSYLHAVTKSFWLRRKWLVAARVRQPMDFRFCSKSWLGVGRCVPDIHASPPHRRRQWPPRFLPLHAIHRSKPDTPNPVTP